MAALLAAWGWGMTRDPMFDGNYYSSEGKWHYEWPAQVADHKVALLKEQALGRELRAALIQALRCCRSNDGRLGRAARQIRRAGDQVNQAPDLAVGMQVVATIARKVGLTPVEILSAGPAI